VRWETWSYRSRRSCGMKEAGGASVIEESGTDLPVDPIGSPRPLEHAPYQQG
jgi:hypothetical protein